MLYKILHDHVHFDKAKLQPAPVRQRRCNQHQLCQLQCRTAYRQAAFLPNTIRDWNSLPDDVAGATTFDTFVSRVQ